jgi:hypothetical protein
MRMLGAADFIQNQKYYSITVFYLLFFFFANFIFLLLRMILMEAQRSGSVSVSQCCT